MERTNSEFTNGSESNDSNNGKKDDKQKRSSVSTNHNKCPICLNIISNRSITDTCFHEFCFECINQWSLHHNHCPICRQIYNNVIFNIVSDEVFEQMPVNQPIEEGIDDILNRMLLFIQLMAIMNERIERRNRILGHLQLINRRMTEKGLKNRNELREQMRQLERESELLEVQINRLEVIGREANPTQMALLNAIIVDNNNNSNENNEDNDGSDTDSIESVPSLESLSINSNNDSNDSGNISDDEESDETFENRKQNIRRKSNNNRNQRNRSRNNRNWSKRSGYYTNKRRKR